MKSKKNSLVIWNVGGSGGLSAKISVPRKFLEDMGLTMTEREIELEYDQEKKELVVRRVEKGQE